MRRPRRALILLGSNIDPDRNLPAAVRLLAAHPGIEVLATSAVYESPPLGRPGDPCFHNAAVAIASILDPPRLRAAMRRIEQVLGRVRTPDRYAPRPIDLDLAAYEGFEGEVGGGRVPDPEIAARAFAAVPLAEVAPDWTLGTGSRTLGEIAREFDLATEHLRRLPGSLEA